MATRKTVEEKLQEAEQKVKQLRELKRKQLARENAAAKKKARQEDAQLKIRFGGLVVLAGLSEADKGYILGALLDAAKNQADPQHVAKLKAAGDALLAKQADENRHSAAAQTQG